MPGRLSVGQYLDYLPASSIPLGIRSWSDSAAAAESPDGPQDQRSLARHAAEDGTTSCLSNQNCWSSMHCRT